MITIERLDFSNGDIVVVDSVKTAEAVLECAKDSKLDFHVLVAPHGISVLTSDRIRQLLDQIEADQPEADEDFPIRKIEIDFAIPVMMTVSIQKQLDEIANKMARATETPEIVHWPAGHGSKPIWNEPNEPTWDNSVYHIDTCARERYESEPFKPRHAKTPPSQTVDESSNIPSGTDRVQ